MSDLKSVAATLAELSRSSYHLTGLEAQPPSLKTSDFAGPVLFSDDPAVSSVPPAFFTVNTLQELKALGGVPDSQYGPAGMAEHHPLPDPFDAQRLAKVSGNHADLCKAFRAYMFGNSQRVSDYQDILNAKRFPMQVALFTGNNLTVSPGKPLIVEDKEGHGNPVVLVYSTITVEPGGQIIYRTNGTVKAQNMNVQGSSGNSAIVNQGGDGGHGASGSSGRNGGNGWHGSSGQDNKNSCASGASSGSNGAPGSDGGHGGDGSKGGNGNDVNIVVEELSGNVIARSIGGQGGDGGSGRNGGNGGYGGSGGASTSQCAAGDGGNGGKGGNGGNGGDGGQGGNGGNVYITYESGTPALNASAVGGTGGRGGEAGAGGSGGAGGAGRTKGNYGTTGKQGTPGKAGAAGLVGKVFVNGRPQ